ncbi:hypothetical protein D3C87_1722850 [compost metagenome]
MRHIELSRHIGFRRTNHQVGGIARMQEVAWPEGGWHAHVLSPRRIGDDPAEPGLVMAADA